MSHVQSQWWESELSLLWRLVTEEHSSFVYFLFGIMWFFFFFDSYGIANMWKWHFSRLWWGSLIWDAIPLCLKHCIYLHFKRIKCSNLWRFRGCNGILLRCCAWDCFMIGYSCLVVFFFFVLVVSGLLNIWCIYFFFCISLI